MTVYIDGLLFLNFYLDFLLLLTVVVILNFIIVNGGGNFKEKCKVI